MRDLEYDVPPEIVDIAHLAVSCTELTEERPSLAEENGSVLDVLMKARASLTGTAAPASSTAVQ